MARFFLAGTNLSGGTAIIRGQDAEHIRVLRMKPGEKVVICDGKGSDYMCRLVRSDEDEAEAEIIEVQPCKAEPTVSVTVFAGLPKGERADLIVQKCTEAGAAEIVFFDCERCVARPKATAIDGKVERFQRIAESAAKQSGRGMIPAVRFIGNYNHVAAFCQRLVHVPLFGLKLLYGREYHTTGCNFEQFFQLSPVFCLYWCLS